MELTWLALVFLAFCGLAYAYEEFEKYRKEKDKEQKSLQRNEIAKEVLESNNIPELQISQLDAVISRIREYLPRKGSSSNPDQTNNPIWQSFIRSNYCPWCKNGHKVKRGGPYAAFIGCSNYPKCHFTTSINANKILEAKIKKEDKEKHKEFFQKEFMEDFRKAYK